MEKGRIIGGKYRILKVLGRGGGGVVYLAEDLRVGTVWAVKRAGRTGFGGKARGFREGEILKELSHPAFPRMVDCLEEEDGVFLVMDYIRGRNLEEWLREHGPFDGKTIWKWAVELCEALDYLHSRKPPVLYRDLKPSNLILDGGGRLRLVDFGIAEKEVSCPSAAGSRRYAAPEQLRAGEPQDARTDIYGLGATLYHLARGQLPENRRRRRIPELSGRLSRILWRCMEEKPEKRFASCRQLLEALDTCRERRPEKRGRPFWRRRRLLACAAAVLAAAAGIQEDRAASRQYRSYLEEAEGAGTAENRIRACREAVSLKRDGLEGYRLLIEIFREDGVFTVQEEKILLPVLEQFPEELRNASGYRELACQVGRLYWFYYCYGEQKELAAMRAAVPWFRRAAAGEEAWARSAEVYAQMGALCQELSLRLREGTEQEKVLELWENLKNLEEQAKKETGAERLELVRFCLRAVRIWRGALAGGGVPEKEQKELCRHLWDCAEETEEGSLRSRELLQKIRQEKAICLEEYSGE